MLLRPFSVAAHDIAQAVLHRLSLHRLSSHRLIPWRSIA